MAKKVPLGKPINWGDIDDPDDPIWLDLAVITQEDIELAQGEAVPEIRPGLEAETKEY